MPTRVLLADDHAIVREGLRLLLERGGDIRVVGEAAIGLRICLPRSPQKKRRELEKSSTT